MSEKLKLVQGDTGPDVVIPLTDGNTGTPVNVSDAGTVVTFEMWPSGDSAVKTTIQCTPIPGRENEDGTIDLSGFYGAPGGGGRVLLRWTPTALATPGLYKAQMVVTLPDGVQQTTYELQPIQIRERVSG